MITRLTTLDDLLRRDFVTFFHRVFQTICPGVPLQLGWHIEILAHHLKQCRRGEIRRLLVTLPPRSLKSMLCSVAFPAFVLGHEPGRQIVAVSYGNDLSAKHGRDGRSVMEAEWYRLVFPETRLDRARPAESELLTTAQGCRLATSVGGTLTGRGGSLIIIDDPMKAQDAWSEAKRHFVSEWFLSTLLSRLDDKSRDVIIVVMQRLHVDDLAGHLLAEGGWVHLNLPAIAVTDERFVLPHGRILGRRAGEVLQPDREPISVLEGLERSMGSAAFSAQYQQDPLPDEGLIVQWSWFRRYAIAPIAQPGDRIVQSWDTATKAGDIHDWSVCTTWLWRGNDHYLLDLLRLRLGYPALRRRVVAEAQRWSAETVLVEDRGSGTQLIQDLRAEGSLRPIPVPASTDKITRMHTVSALLEAGHVLLPEQAPWLDDFRTELLQFPHGRHDDQADSLSQYLGWVRDKANQRETWGPEHVICGQPSAFSREYRQTFGGAPSPWLGWEPGRG